MTAARLPDCPDPGDEFTDEEARFAAEHVAALYPDGCPPRLFDSVIWPFVFGLGLYEKGEARTRIFNALPERCRRSFWSLLEADFASAVRVSPRAAQALGYDHLEDDDEAA